MALITDLDNTLYNWVDFYGPAFRAMVHALSKKTKVNESDIIDGFRRAYKTYKSVEYQYSLQANDAFSNMTFDEVRELVELMQIVFGKAKRKNLKLYPGVIETLRWARNVGIYIIGATDAPVNLADWRLQQLGIAKYFNCLVAWKGPDAPETLAQNRKIQWVRKIFSLEHHERKPSTVGYLRALNTFDIKPCSAYVIGDSLFRDIKPALEIGAVGIWAKYGEKHNSKNLDTIRTITDWSHEKIKNELDKESITPSFVVNSFSDIKAIIKNPPQMKLPGI